jgi:hypothetical protein
MRERLSLGRPIISEEVCWLVVLGCSPNKRCVVCSAQPAPETGASQPASHIAFTLPVSVPGHSNAIIITSCSTCTCMSCTSQTERLRARCKTCHFPGTSTPSAGLRIPDFDGAVVLCERASVTGACAYTASTKYRAYSHTAGGCLQDKAYATAVRIPPPLKRRTAFVLASLSSMIRDGEANFTSSFTAPRARHMLASSMVVFPVHTTQSCR